MRSQFLEAGQVVGAHGIQGEIKVLPWADGPEFLTQFSRIYLSGRPWDVESARVHKNVTLVKLRGVDNPEDARRLRGRLVTVEREGLELPEGRAFIADLIGLQVFADGEEIGRIQDVLTLPANHVYVVRGAHEYMIPAVKDFLEEVNVDGGYVRVRLLEGMRTDAD